MDFKFTPSEEAFREEVRQWLKEKANPSLDEDMKFFFLGRVHPEMPDSVREFTREVGKKGWLGMNWPKKYGGQERSIIEQLIAIEEVEYSLMGFYNFEALTMMGPTLLERGSEALKESYLPRIASGEMEMALGYTEPQAGSDLASLELRAEKSDGYYILNGQKTFNSVGHYADAFWLGVRTQKIVPKHRGISMIIADAKTPGITIRPLWRMDGGRANEVFFDDVRVPEENLVGEENKGWYYLMEALNRERIFATHIGTLQRILDDLVQYARETEYNGKLIAGNSLFRHSLAEMAIETKIARLFMYNALWMDTNNMEMMYEGAMLKLFSTELSQRLANVGMQMSGLLGQLHGDSKYTHLKWSIETAYAATIIRTVFAGTSEIQRTIMALRGLGLPSS